MAADVQIHPNGDIFMPSLDFLQINEENINHLMEIFKLSQEDLSNQLTYRVDEDCESLYNSRGAHILESFEGDYIVVDYPIGEWPGAGIIGYLSIVNRGIFRHKTTGKKAIIAYISWTCSMTSSTENKLNEYLSNKLYYFKKNYNNKTTISINKFAVHNISKLLFNSVRDIDYVLLYSLALEDAKNSHRAARKKSACTFLTEWNSIIDNTPILPKDDINDEDNMIYLWSPVQSTNNIYNFFKKSGSNISNYNENTGNLGCSGNASSALSGFGSESFISSGLYHNISSIRPRLLPPEHLPNNNINMTAGGNHRSRRSKRRKGKNKKTKRSKRN